MIDRTLPGVGKTTLAKIIAHVTQSSFIEFSAVMSGIKEIKNVMIEAEKAAQFGSRTILFIDEIHRFNKAQQDAFLPYVERGTIRLIGATTENPSFEINAALLSRCRVYTLVALTEAQIIGLLKSALTNETQGLGAQNILIDDAALAMIASYSSGDARYAYNALEIAAKLAGDAAKNSFDTKHITEEIAGSALQQRVLLYDKKGEQHYDVISALHKSVRNPTWTPRSTGLAACSPPAKIPCTSPAASSAWPSKMSASPHPKLSTYASPPAMPCTSSGHPKATSP